LAYKAYCGIFEKILSLLGIKLIAKPLDKPSAVTENQIRSGERNPILGKFGQVKTAYGISRIKARIKDNVQSWIASIIEVLNLIKPAGPSPLLLQIFSADPIYSISCV